MAIDFALQKKTGVRNNATLTKLWATLGICQSGIYVYEKQKSNREHQLEPSMLEAYVGFCNGFDNRWSNASGGVLGNELTFKTQRGTDPFCGSEYSVDTRICARITLIHVCPHFLRV